MLFSPKRFLCLCSPLNNSTIPEDRQQQDDKRPFSFGGYEVNDYIKYLTRPVVPNHKLNLLTG